MSATQMYRTNPDGTRVPIDWRDGKTFEEKLADFDKPLEGRGGQFLQHVANVLSGKEEARTPVGKLFALLAHGRGDDSSHYRDVIIDENPRPRAGSDLPENGGISGVMQNSAEVIQAKAEGPLARMQRERREAESARNPEGAAVANAINDTAKELGVSGASLMEAITTANNHVVPGQKSRALEEVANTLGVSPQELIKAGRNHGFTMEDGKIIVEVREQPSQKVSSSMLNGFERPEWAGSHQAKHDDTPQGARVASAAGHGIAVEGRV